MAGDHSRSLGKGSAAPGPVPEGVIRLYSMRFCPFAQRARLVLRAKGISHEVININLKNKPDWFFEKNPFGLVPVLETSKGQLIYESPITCEYLDEAFPGKKLLPLDPYERAFQKMLLEYFSKLTPIVFKYYVAVRDGQDTSALKAEFVEKLGKLEEDFAAAAEGELRMGERDSHENLTLPIADDVQEVKCFEMLLCLACWYPTEGAVFPSLELYSCQVIFCQTPGNSNILRCFLKGLL
ncbi:glutathione S-transferase omega-1 isoform X2 [Apteryx rowi]|uniref:glutathione S-transferase omega-1 isoform X2 n=1 Tax=Apteryx rowi TaxID=308060 RepID=UPI000E1E1983|nr:glutathione S-transferase omega-1 isoform X2 [Apteryx rowi]